MEVCHIDLHRALVMQFGQVQLTTWFLIRRSSVVIYYLVEVNRVVGGQSPTTYIEVKGQELGKCRTE